MPVLDRWGPPAPPKLVTLNSARMHGVRLRVTCAPCKRSRLVEGRSLPPSARSLTLGELWLAGRFRCGGCKGPATAVEIIVSDQTTVSMETWRLGDPLVAERLRRHWRHDRDDRRDWKSWFAEG